MPWTACFCCARALLLYLSVYLAMHFTCRYCSHVECMHGFVLIQILLTRIICVVVAILILSLLALVLLAFVTLCGSPDVRAFQLLCTCCSTRLALRAMSIVFVNHAHANAKFPSTLL